MKRVNPIECNPHGVVKHYTYFEWSQCMKCNLDFRRENGVMFKWFKEVKLHLCVDCSHNANIKWVNEYITWLYSCNNYKNPPTGR